MNTDKMHKAFANYHHDLTFKAYLQAAYREFMELSFWRIVFYMLLFMVTEGWILIYANLYWIIKAEIKKKKLKKTLKNNKKPQDLGEND